MPKRRAKPVTPTESAPPIVRHGDVLAVLFGEVRNAFDEMNAGRKLRADLEAYIASTPNVDARLVAILRGGSSAGQGS